MKKHILLEKAYCYPEPIAGSVPIGYTFQEISGYWINSLTGEAMMLCNDAGCPMSKKEDRETGEDQKGE